MNFVIPMGGIGARFKSDGYSMPKPLIKAHGKTLLQWSVDSLPLNLSKKLVFILNADLDNEYAIIDKINSWYKDYNVQFYILEHKTRGQAETVLKAKSIYSINESLLIFNIDTFFRSKDLPLKLLSDADGVLGCFNSNSGNYSYAKADKNGIVDEVREKKVISNNALNGLYFFKRSSDFIDIAEYYIEKNLTEKGEFYVAPMYNDLIQKNKKIILSYTDMNYVLGTPKELDFFKSNYK